VAIRVRVDIGTMTCHLQVHRLECTSVRNSSSIATCTKGLSLNMIRFSSPAKSRSLVGDLSPAHAQPAMAPVVYEFTASEPADIACTRAAQSSASANLSPCVTYIHLHPVATGVVTICGIDILTVKHYPVLQPVPAFATIPMTTKPTT
jgi:hypothetical protein